MKIMVMADVESGYIWDHYQPGMLRGIDLIISCGDLNPQYLSFVETFANVPLLYVRGNHDGIYDETPPGGGTCIDGKIVSFGGLRIMGLGGCMRFREGKDNYTESEMNRRIRRMAPALLRAGGIDILMTHAPAKGYGDLPDLPHEGFAAFDRLLEKRRPAWMLHGHVHASYGRIRMEHLHPCGTRIINVSGYRILEL